MKVELIPVPPPPDEVRISLSKPEALVLRTLLGRLGTKTGDQSRLYIYADALASFYTPTEFRAVTDTLYHALGSVVGDPNPRITGKP